MTKTEMATRMAAIVKAGKDESRSLTEAERYEFDSLSARYAAAGVAETRGVIPDVDPGIEKRAEADNNFTKSLRTGEVRNSTGLTTSPDNNQSSTEDAGYMIPQGFWQNLQIALKAYGGVANDFRVVMTDTGNPMPWPTVNPTAVTASIVGTENTQLSTVSPYVFGQGMLSAWTLCTSPILASLQIVEYAAFDIDQFLADRFGESIGRELAALAIAGTGSAQPLGIITALAASSQWSAGNSGGYIQLGTATSVAEFGGSTTELG